MHKDGFVPFGSKVAEPPAAATTLTKAEPADEPKASKEDTKRKEFEANRKWAEEAEENKIVRQIEDISCETFDVYDCHERFPKEFDACRKRRDECSELEDLVS